MAPVKNYRHDIDGLRALAVLPMVLHDASFDLLSGGYVGVDILSYAFGEKINYVNEAGAVSHAFYFDYL